MTVFYVTVNKPGYSPEGEPIGCETLDDARAALQSELMATSEVVGPDDAADMDAWEIAEAEAVKNALTLNAGDSIMFAGYAHSITESDEPF